MKYLARRLGFYLLALWASITINFFLPRLLPGDPAATILSGSGAATMDPVQVQALREALGLSDAPLFQQYLIYLSRILRFDFGTSFSFFPAPVSQVISTGLIWTVLLGMTSVIISFTLGNILGVIGSWRRGGIVDTLMPPLLILIGAFPPFFLALMAFYFLANQWNLFPTGHAYADTLSPSFSLEFIGSVIYHLILPAAVIVLASMGGWAIGMRNVMVSVLAEDYITMAEAKGLKQPRIMFMYAARNAMLPGITSFGIAPGEVFGLAGESGSGKSTIAHAIMRVLRPPAIITGGQVLLQGEDVMQMGDDEIEAFRWRDVSMVFQSAMNSLNPVITIGDQIMDVLMTHQGLSVREARNRAAELLTVVNIDTRRLDSYAHQLSGGMRQRVVIAIALALNPALMIMDEPTTALDVVVQKDIMQQIGQLKEKMGFSVLFITHDLSLMVEFSNRIAIMYAGQIVELAEAKELFNNPLHPYTQGLLSSFPPLHGPKRRMTGIPGSPPNMAEPPSGCRFHPRCTLCKPIEKQAAPRLREVMPGHWLAYHTGMPVSQDIAALATSTTEWQP